jgi:hypothetical protein
MTMINLSIKQIMELADYCGLICEDGGMDESDLECEISIVENGLVTEDDAKTSAWLGAYAYFSEYPEEGCMPLNDNLITGDVLKSAQEALKIKAPEQQ